MATTNNDQTAVNTNENTPTTVNANVDQTVPNTTDTKVVDEPTNIQPPPIETVPVNLPQNPSPIITNTINIDKPASLDSTAVNETKSVEVASIDKVGATKDQPVTFQISSEEGTVAEDPTTATPKSVNDTVVTANLTNVEPQTSKQPSGTGSNPRAVLIAVVRKSYRLFIGLGIILIISLLELSIGWNYADQCPAHWRIPHYLVVAGTIGIVIVAIVTIQTFLQFNTSSKKDRPSALLAFGSIGLLVVLILLFLFSIGWFIAGCIWVFRAWNKVQYKNPKRSDYCHSTLYRFAFWVLILTICYILLLSYRIIQRIRQVVKNSKKGLPKPVPTAEV